VNEEAVAELVDHLLNSDSRNAGGVNLLLGDGSARFVSETIGELTWRAIGAIAGEEPLSDGAF
jgi:hypothetical protein